MENEKGLKKILKWAGLVALMAVPVIVLLKKRKTHQSDVSVEDESNIFATELEE